MIKTTNNWLLASNNSGKIKEINHLLKQFHITIKSQAEYNIPEIEETGLTFVENALLKARHACSITNMPTLADDSGLVVPALNGEPGIYSARYANTGNSQDNINKLIQKLSNLNNNTHNKNIYKAYFYCTIVLLKYPNDPTPIISEGIWHGEITLEPKGSNGFGYDPIFFDPKTNLTAAELMQEQKQKVSHRGKALEGLINKLQKFRHTIL